MPGSGYYYPIFPIRTLLEQKARLEQPQQKELKSSSLKVVPKPRDSTPVLNSKDEPKPPSWVSIIKKEKKFTPDLQFNFIAEDLTLNSTSSSSSSSPALNLIETDQNNLSKSSASTRRLQATLNSDVNLNFNNGRSSSPKPSYSNSSTSKRLRVILNETSKCYVGVGHGQLQSNKPFIRRGTSSSSSPSPSSISSFADAEDVDEFPILKPSKDEVSPGVRRLSIDSVVVGGSAPTSVIRSTKSIDRLPYHPEHHHNICLKNTYQDFDGGGSGYDINPYISVFSKCEDEPEDLSINNRNNRPKNVTTESNSLSLHLSPYNKEDGNGVQDLSIHSRYKPPVNEESLPQPKPLAQLTEIYQKPLTEIVNHRIELPTGGEKNLVLVPKEQIKEPEVVEVEGAIGGKAVEVNPIKPKCVIPSEGDLFIAEEDSVVNLSKADEDDDDSLDAGGRRDSITEERNDSLDFNNSSDTKDNNSETEQVKSRRGRRRKDDNGTGVVKQYICFLCNFTSPRESVLNNHMTRMHTVKGNRGNVRCTVCAYSCPSVEELRSHQELIHGGDDPGQQAPVAYHACTHCTKKFRSQAQLQAHLRLIDRKNKWKES